MKRLIVLKRDTIYCLTDLILKLKEYVRKSLSLKKIENDLHIIHYYLKW